MTVFSIRDLAGLHEAVAQRLEAVPAGDYQRVLGGTEVFRLDYAPFPDGYAQDAGAHLGFSVEFEQALPLEARHHAATASLIDVTARVALRYDTTPSTQVEDYRNLMRATGDLYAALLDDGPWLPDGAVTPLARFRAELPEEGTYMVGYLTVSITLEEVL